MKKTLTILSAFLILLSGVQLTIATHYCNNRVTGTKISFSGTPASCGMKEQEKPAVPFTKQLDSHCCDNQFSTVGTFDIFIHPGAPTAFDYQVSHQTVFTRVTPLILRSYNNAIYTDSGPPGNNLKASSVRLDDICEFRI
jgi:hypothetical protein